MATERYDARIDPEEWKSYFRHYADIILPMCRGKVLDLGCGQGWLTKEIASLPEVDSILAVDKFGEQPEENKDIRITYVQSEIPAKEEEFNFLPNFDTIVSTEFVEHITQENLEVLLPKIHKWLAPNGLFVGSTPNKLVPTVNPYHLREYTVDELKELFDKYGFTGEYHLPRRDLTVWIVNKK